MKLMHSFEMNVEPRRQSRMGKFRVEEDGGSAAAFATSGRKLDDGLEGAHERTDE